MDTSSNNAILVFDGDYIFDPERTPKSILDFLEEYPPLKDADDKNYRLTNLFKRFKRTGKSVGYLDFVDEVQKEFGDTAPSKEELRDMWASNQALINFALRNGLTGLQVAKAFPIERLFMVAY